MNEIIQVNRYKGEGSGEKQHLKVLIDRIKEDKEATQQCFSPTRGAELSSLQPYASGKQDPKPSWIPGLSWLSRKPSHASCCWLDLLLGLFGEQFLVVPSVGLGAKGMCQDQLTQVSLFCSQPSSPPPPPLGKQIKLLQESEALCSPGLPGFHATSRSNFSWHFFRNSNCNVSGLIKPNSGWVSKENTHLSWYAPT